MSVRLFASILLMITLTSCATDSGGIVSGSIGEVSADDFRTVLAVDLKEQPHTQGQLVEIRVISHNEMRLYWRDHPGYHILRRIHGNWYSAGKIDVN